MESSIGFPLNKKSIKMANEMERYKSLDIRNSLLSSPYRYPFACKEIGVIIRFCYTKLSKLLQSLLFDDTLFAFRLLPQLQTQSAVSAATLLLQSAESVFPKQKRALAATEFKQAMIAYKRRSKIPHDDKDSVCLPQDVLVHLFYFLDVQSLLTAGLVCRMWNAAANDNYLWYLQYNNYFGDSEGSPHGETAITKQHVSSSALDSNTNRRWKYNFKKTYIGLPNKFDRSFCLCCNLVVWLNKLKCPNQCHSRRVEEHQLESLSPTEIGSYIMNGRHIPWFLVDSDDSDEEPDEEEMYGIPSYRILGEMLVTHPV